MGKEQTIGARTVVRAPKVAVKHWQDNQRFAVVSSSSERFKKVCVMAGR